MGGQEVDVAEEDVGREGLGQGHVAELVDGVEGALPVHHVVGHVLPGREHRRGLHETQELLGLCVCQVQGQAHGARPVPAQGFQHLQPGVRGVVSPGEGVRTAPSSGLLSPFQALCELFLFHLHSQPTRWVLSHLTDEKTEGQRY